MERFSLLARALRYPLRSNPRRFWLLTLALATAIALVITTVVAEARQVTAQLGDRRSVVIARRSLDPGMVVTDADISMRDLPTGWLPDDVVLAAQDVIGSTVIVAIMANEAVVSERVGSSADASDAASAKLAADERGIAIAVPSGFDLGAGTQVELIVSDASFSAPESSTNDAPVAIGGRVIATDQEGAGVSPSGRWATVAVDVENATVAAQASRANRLSLVLAPEN